MTQVEALRFIVMVLYVLGSCLAFFTLLLGRAFNDLDRGFTSKLTTDDIVTLVVYTLLWPILPLLLTTCSIVDMLAATGRFFLRWPTGENNGKEKAEEEER